MKVIDKGMKGVKRFTVMDFGIFKVCIFVLGILTGVYFFDYFKNKKGILWTTFGVSYAHTMCRTFATEKYPHLPKKHCCLSKKHLKKW